MICLIKYDQLKASVNNKLLQIDQIDVVSASPSQNDAFASGQAPPPSVSARRPESPGWRRGRRRW
jgi:hypothetical protein